MRTVFICLLWQGAILWTTDAQAAPSKPEVAPTVSDEAGQPVPSKISPSIPLRREDAPAFADRGSSVFQFMTVLVLFATAAFWLMKKKGVKPASSSIAFWLKGFGASPSAKALQVVQSTRLTAQASLHVVQWDGKEWMVGCTDQGLSILANRVLEVDVSSPLQRGT